MLPSGLSEHIPDNEDLSRFLTSSKWFNLKMVKPVAFLPNPKADNTTSVFRHGSEPREELWRIGQENLPDRKWLGVAVFDASRVRAALLEVVAQEPPPRHANIVGWDLDEDPVLQRAKQREQATAIARHAELVRREPV